MKLLGYSLLFISISFAEAKVESRELYIDLLRKCLIGSIYKDPSFQPGNQGYNAEKRELGRDWPSMAHTMIGLKRLNNIQYCYENVLKEGIPGDLIETGVWRGGATIFMRGLLKAYDDNLRTVWVADSFEGLPVANASIYPSDQGLQLHKLSQLAVSLEEVKDNFDRYGLLDSQVKFLKGWFKDTLPSAPIEKLSILRLDGDYYESTIQALEYLYPKLSVGGYVIIDDYVAFKACKEAVHDYRKKNGITEEIIHIDGRGVFWKKLK